MQDFPHRYRAEASARVSGPVSIASPDLDPLSSLPPAEFGGPGDHWSPETLLVASVVDCFVLGFRAIARASSFAWISLRCEGEGELDRVERVTRFTRIALRATLAVPPDADATKAGRLLEKAERSCLVSNSLVCPVELASRIEIGDGSADAPV